MKTPPGSRKLPIRTRRTLDGDGVRSIDETVYCEHREASIDVDDCIACPDCRYVTFSSADGSYLVCDRPAGEVLPPTPGTVAAVMSPVVHCVRPTTTVAALVQLLLESAIGGAPIVDGDGRAVGVVSKTDVIRSMHEGRNPATTAVSEIMMPMVFSLRSDATIERAAALMAFEGVHRIPIVTRDGLVIGIITPLDVAKAIARRSGDLP